MQGRTFHAGPSPFQCALTTKAGGECVAHAIQSLTDLDSRATVLSIDGIGAFDMISRVAMLDGLCASFCAPVLLRPLPVFLDRQQRRHPCDPPGEGGEQGDALMPMLYALGQHGALLSLQDFLLPDEHLFAY